MQRADLALELRVHTSAVSTGIAHEALALTLMRERKPHDAEREERLALELFREGAAPDHWRIWSAQRNLAFMLATEGRTQQGLALLDSAIALTLSYKGPREAAYLTAQRVPFLLALDRVDEAARSLAQSERQLAASTTVSAAHRGDLNRYAGMVALASGDARTAAQRFAAAVSLEPTETVPNINSCLLGVSYARLGRSTDARPLLAEPCARYEAGASDPMVVGWIEAARHPR